MNTEEKKEDNAAPPQRVWKIEGEAFQRVKAKADAYKKIIDDLTRARDEHWEEIFAVTGASKGDDWHIDSTYESEGLYFLKEKKPSVTDLLFHAMMAGSVKKAA